MNKIKQMPPRKKVKKSYQWDLSSLCSNDQSWKKAFTRWERQIAGYEKFRGCLGDGAGQLAACLRFGTAFERLGERIGTYALLKSSEDLGNSTYQAMLARFHNAASRAAEAASFIRPEILALPTTRLKRVLSARELEPYRITLQRLLRHKPHTLSDREERLLAMQIEMAASPGQIFGQLNDADLKFGSITNETGERIELSHATFIACLHSPKRSVRRAAFDQFYRQYSAHKNTLAATVNASVQRDIYYARARGYDSSLAAALFEDNVPVSVYDNLIAAVHRHLPALYRYYQLRRRAMRLRDIHHYDTYVPIIRELRRRRTWDQAVTLILRALEPLGSHYCGVLEKGLQGGWCDKYENQGKRSGAFSCGSYDGDPYILMNYQPELLEHVFTLAHEAGHSMHSHYSANHQPFQYYQYTIFVAEVASTFNEQLLSRYLMAQVRSDRERAFLINREIDAIRATIFRQTMFAEFERIIHALAENNEPLTVERIRSEYRKLLEQYFGPDFTLDDELSLECLRIPHFYRAFYVYKYATGMSAAIALSDRVLGGGKRELDCYHGFLKAGCSKYPLELLRDAGVDMERPDAVNAALGRFERLVEELDRLL